MLVKRLSMIEAKENVSRDPSQIYRGLVFSKNQEALQRLHELSSWDEDSDSDEDYGGYRGFDSSPLSDY